MASGGPIVSSANFEGLFCVFLVVIVVDTSRLLSDLHLLTTLVHVVELIKMTAFQNADVD